MFNFQVPRPETGRVQVVRYWISSRGNPLSATEVYGPNGLIGSPANITGEEISEAQYNSARREIADILERQDREDVVVEREAAAAQRNSLSVSANRRREAVEIIAEAIGVTTVSYTHLTLPTIYSV